MPSRSDEVPPVFRDRAVFGRGLDCGGWRCGSATGTPAVESLGREADPLDLVDVPLGLVRDIFCDPPFQYAGDARGLLGTNGIDRRSCGLGGHCLVIIAAGGQWYRTATTEETAESGEFRVDQGLEP